MKLAPSVFALCGLLGMSLGSAQSQERPPATPLITHDPYFSIWSMTDRLTDSDTSHWTGSAQPIAGIARIDGKAYRFMGASPDAVPAMSSSRAA
jgi:xanthosine utilization system XapX-like protein